MAGNTVFQDEINAAEAEKAAAREEAFARTNREIESRLAYEGAGEYDFGSGWEPVSDEDLVSSNLAQDQADFLADWESFINYTNVDDLGIPVDFGAPGSWFPGLGATDPWEHVTDGGPGPQLDPAWAIESWETGGLVFSTPELPGLGPSQDIFVRYDPSKSTNIWHSMSGDTREGYYNSLVEAGLLSKEWKGAKEFSLEGAEAFGRALTYANFMGKPIGVVLGSLASSRPKGGGSGRKGPVVKMEVPDYDTMLVQSKDLLKQALNRNPEDWEMSLIADEMKAQYGTWADAKERAALGGNGTYEVPDPRVLTRGFLEDTYSNEINRIETREDTRINNALTLNALTKGRQMIGAYGA